MIRTKPLKRTALKRKARKKQPGDDPKYLEWIRTRCCWVCMQVPHAFPASPTIWYCSVQKTPTEAHHAGAHAFARRAPDRSAIPLCARHHRTGSDAAHVLGKNFWTHHKLDRDQIIKELNERYNQLHV